jgi:hypothetical protein
MADIQPSKAVYYPHLEFGSAAWVKGALLYWEGLVRSRPPQSSPQDDPEIQQLLAAGLIEEVWFERDRRRLTPEMGQQVEELMRSHGGRLPPGIPSIEGARGAPPELEQRVRKEVLEDLDGYPLAQEAFSGDLGRARTLFFTFITDRIANAHGLVPVTDDPIFHAIATYFEQEGITRDATKLTEADGSAIAQLCLPAPSLEALAELPVERLLEIREKYAAQRRRFRQKVQAQVASIVELPTAKAIEDRLKTFQEEIQDDLEAAREAVKDAKTRERWTLLGISAPASLAAGMSIAATASPVLGPVGGIGTLALGMTSWFMRKRNGSGPGSHYLLSVDAAVKEPWRRLTRAFGALVNE